MTKQRAPFSIPRFALQVAAQCALLALALRFAFPDLWARQVAAGPLAFVGAFLGMHLFVAFFEWFFHRYVLHGITSPWLQQFAKAHRNHHSLTAIRLRPVAAGSDRYILNEYPITSPEQFEDAEFPVYALVTFWAIFTPVLLLAQWALPAAPVMLGGYAAIAWSMSLYEILHSLEHRPYEWWQRATEHPRTGAMWRRLYGFHHMHHANVGCNEAISGFFGLPLPDWCFGTYHQPRELLLDGRMATAKDFAVRPPRAWVRVLDGWARRREARVSRSAA